MALRGIRGTGRTATTSLAGVPALLVGFVMALSLALVLGLPAVAHAHGASVEFDKGTEAVRVKAVFDSGEPMGGAQVAVYAPGDGSEPWVSGTADQQGRFFFAPDTSKDGAWQVEVRKAGHGETIEVPVRQPGEGQTATSEGASPGAGQSGSPEAAGGSTSTPAPPPGQQGAAAADAEPVADSETATGQAGGDFGPLQIALMAALGVWGLVGTALFFVRREAA